MGLWFLFPKQSLKLSYKHSEGGGVGARTRSLTYFITDETEW